MSDPVATEDETWVPSPFQAGEAEPHTDDVVSPPEPTSDAPAWAVELLAELRAARDDIAGISSAEPVDADDVATKVSDHVGAIVAEKVDQTLSAISGTLDAHSTEFEVLHGLLVGAIKTMSDASDSQVQSDQQSRQDVAAMKAATEESLTAVRAAQDQLNTIAADWERITSGVTSIDSKTDSVSSAVLELVNYVGATSDGMLTVLERHDRTMETVLEKLIGPDDLRTHLAEIRLAVGGLSQTLSTITKRINPKEIAAITDKIELVMGEVVTIRGGLEGILGADFEDSLPAVSLADISRDLADVRGVRTLLEQIKDLLEESVAQGINGAATLAAEAGELLNQVTQTALEVSEIRLLAAGNAEDTETTATAVANVHAIVEALSEEVGHKLSSLTERATRLPAAAAAKKVPSKATAAKKTAARKPATKGPART